MNLQLIYFANLRF